MMRFLKIFFWSMVVTGLMVGSALAGPVQSNFGAANLEFVLATEVMGIPRDITIIGPGAAPNVPANYAVSYVVGQAISSGCLIQVNFTGGSFNGSLVNVCAANGGSPLLIGTATPPTTATSYPFNFNAVNAAPAGSTIYFTSGATCNAAVAPTQYTLYLRAAANSGPMPITVSLLSGGSAPLDPAGSANFARVATEFRANIAAVNHSVDYLATPGDGTRLIPGNVAYAALNGAAVGGAVNVARTNRDYNVNSGAVNANLTAAAVISLTDTGNWQGLSKVFLFNGSNPGTCTDNAATNLVGTGALNGTLTFSIPAGAFNGAGGLDTSVCLIGAGNQTLTIPRTISAIANVDVTGSGALDPSPSASTAIDTWDTNAYQGIVTWLVNSSVLPTYCLIANNDLSRTSTLRLEIITSEGGVVLASSLGTLTPKNSVLATFTGNSASVAGGTAIDLTTLGADKRYVARITSTTNPNNTTVTCIQTDPATGVKRAVPVLTNSPWRQ